MAETPQTWTNTYRGDDDAAMIGAFIKDAAVAQGAGWRPVEQSWGNETGARVLTVRYERTAEAPPPPPAGTLPAATSTSSRQKFVATSHSPSVPGGGGKAQKAPKSNAGGAGGGATRDPNAWVLAGTAAAGAAAAGAAARGAGTAAGAGPASGAFAAGTASTAWRTGTGTTAGTSTGKGAVTGKGAGAGAAWNTRTETGARPKRGTVSPSALRTGIARTGGSLFLLGFGFLVFGDAGVSVEKTGTSLVLIGLGTWLSSRVLQGLASRAVGAPSLLANPLTAGTAALVAAWLVIGGIGNLPLRDLGLGFGGGPGATDDPVAQATSAPRATTAARTPRPTKTPRPPRIAITSPADGGTVSSSPATIAGTAPAGDTVTCSHGDDDVSVTVADDGTWHAEMPIEPGFNLIVCSTSKAIGITSIAIIGGTGSPRPSGSPSDDPGGVSFSISGGGTGPIRYGPFVFPKGSVRVTWAVSGSARCTFPVSFTATGAAKAALSFVARADAGGAGNGTATLTSAAETPYLISGVSNCQGWSLAFDSDLAEPLLPSASPPPTKKP